MTHNDDHDGYAGLVFLIAASLVAAIVGGVFLALAFH